MDDDVTPEVCVDSAGVEVLAAPPPDDVDPAPSTAGPISVAVADEEVDPVADTAAEESEVAPVVSAADIP